MSKWVGYAVSVSCGEPLGCYQGTIAAADGSTITLTKAFRNGFPYPKSQVTLNAADIKELRIIEERGAPGVPATSTVAVARGRKGSKATVCENLQANSSTAGNQTSQSNGGSGGKGSRSSGGGGSGSGSASTGGATPARSKPIDIQGGRPAKNNQPGSYGQSGSGGGGGGHSGGGGGHLGGSGGHSGGAGGGRWTERARRRNEDCFGAAADLSRDDFDFEGNLALFDKRALWEQMSTSTKPDLVRHAEAGKYRHDENVLGGAAGGGGQPVALPARLAAGGAYLTDAGALVPAAAPHARSRLWHLMDQYGVGETALALLARAAADVCLRLAGGGRRLEPRNLHQRPAAAALAAPGRAGAAALLAARLLASHGVAVAVHTPGAPEEIAACSAVQRELAALALCGVTPRALQQLPASPDLLLLALPPVPGGDRDHGDTQAALNYACAARGAAVLVEPTGAEGSGGAAWPSVRAAVCALLPPPAPPAAAGRVYLADVAPPPAVFAALGVRYRPPFGAAPLLPLHPAPPDLVPDLVLDA